MFTILDRLFSMEQSFQLVASKFNHCSTVCPINNGSLVAWYSGTKECADDQSVYIVFINREISEIIRIGDKTGNPVLWKTDQKRAILLYSKFENAGTIRRLVDRWKYCSLWVQHVELDKSLRLVGNPIQLTEPTQHLLGRCAPLMHSGQLLIPLYDEVARNGVIANFKNDNFTFMSSVGVDMIQPTLWAHNGKLCCLSRNFGSTMNYSLYCESADGGINWSDPSQTLIPNNNSSLHVRNFNGIDYIMWNNTTNRYRSLMTFGELTTTGGFLSAKPIEIISEEHGAYPWLECANNRIVMSFTRNQKIICNVWNTKAVNKRRRNSSR